MHGFTRLGDIQEFQKITDTVNNIAALSKLRKPNGAAQANQEEDFEDSHHLTGQNLEAENRVDLESARFQVKLPKLCGRCADGFISIARNTSKICPFCKIPKDRIKRLNKLNLPAGARNMHLDCYEFDSEKQHQCINQIINDMRTGEFGKGAFLFGRPGNGKSSILFALARWATMEGYRVLYSSHTDLLEAVQATWKSKDYEDALDSFLFGYKQGSQRQKTLLLIDEFGGPGGSLPKHDWIVKSSNKLVHKLYEYFQSNLVTCVITSNLHPRNLFSSLLNESSKERMLEMLNAVEMKGASRRQATHDPKVLEDWGLR